MHRVPLRLLTSLGVLVLSACSDDGGRGSATATPTTSITGITGITLTSSPETTAADSSGQPTAGSGSDSAGSTSTASGTTTTSGGLKFDMGMPQPDFGMPDEGPIIPETCEQALAGKSTVGCKFFAVDMDSHDQVETSQYAVAVANVQLNATATVSVEAKNGGVWGLVGGPQQIGPLQLFTFILPDRHTDDSAFAPGNAYRITSDIPVVAYQFNPVDGASSFLSDAAMLYPAAALDTLNRVTAWRSMFDNTNTFQHSYATIIATVDGTQVTVTPSVPTAAGNGVPAGQPGVPFMIDMQEGDVLSVAVQSIPDSMTGTKIASNDGHPVAVFAGQECALIPENVCCCDHMEEQLAGVRLWGKRFISARMPVRNPGNPEATLWQIFASEDGTNVQINADPGVTGIPAPQFLLNSGQMSEFYATGPDSEPGDFEVVADKPIAVYGYMVGSENFGSMIGDPAMVAMAPVEQFLPRYVILVPSTWMNDVAVVTRPVGAPILLDNMPIPDTEFNPVAGSGYEVARIQLTDGVHLFDGADAAFGVVIVGYDGWDSYAYLGGTGTGKINPNPPG